MMRHISKLVCICLVAVWLLHGHPVWSAEATAPAADGESEVCVMTFNIRYGTAEDGPNHWDQRKDRLVATIRRYDPDLIGTQETMTFQADYLQQQLPEYAYVGKLRQPDQADSEQSGVLFRRARFVDLEQGHFWLSETPDVPGSRSWDSSLPRMVTWLKLFDRQTQKTLVWFNTHFDHQGAEARRQAALLLAKRVAGVDPLCPVIVTGDFNCGEDSPPYQALLAGDAAAPRLRDAYRLAQPTRTAEEGTFNGFRGNRTGARIDWILVSPEWRVHAAEIVLAAPGEPSPSDHCPVVARLRRE